MKKYNTFFLLAVLNLEWQFINGATERIRYLSLEHPNITYYNPTFLGYLNVTGRRLSRKDPIHYYDYHFTVLREIDNRFTMDVYFYEWLTNVYKPTFVEMHFRWCNLVHRDSFFGSTMKQGNLTIPCPQPAGEYHLYNMSVPSQSIPRTFPFTRGRIYGYTFWQKSKDEPKQRVAEGYTDMEIKTWIRKS